MNYLIGSYTSLGGAGLSLLSLEGDALRVKTSLPLDNPSYVIWSNKAQRAYLALETSESAVSACALEAGALTPLASAPTGGNACCHLTLHPNGRFLYAANYTSGNLSAFPVTAEGVGARIQLVQHEGNGPNKARQEGPHAHYVAFRPGTNQLYAVDLGMDAIVIYDADEATGLLRQKQLLRTAPGMGPRHLQFFGGALYVVYEMGNAVSAFLPEGDSWRCAQTLSTLPEGFEGRSSCAALRVGQLADGSFRLIASNRWHDSLAFYAFQPDGTLLLEGIHPTLGRTPRDFLPIGGGLLLVAHQDSGDLRLFSYDGRAMVQRGETLPCPGAVCVCAAGDA